MAGEEIVLVFMSLFTVQLLISLAKVWSHPITLIILIGIANPIGTILSGAMLLECSLGMVKEAKALEEAVRRVLDVKQMRTKDLGGNCSTEDIGDAVAMEFKSILNGLY